MFGADPGEVLVKVKAAGICGSDIPRIYQTGTYHFPTIPGHEFAGVVEATGENVDSGWKEKRVCGVGTMKQWSQYRNTRQTKVFHRQIGRVGTGQPVGEIP